MSLNLVLIHARESLIVNKNKASKDFAKSVRLNRFLFGIDFASTYKSIFGRNVSTPIL